MKLIEKLNQFRFNRAVKAIDKTPPLRLTDGHSLTVLSMVQHRDVLRYLLALKSLARFLMPDKVVLVADPTLNARDREILQRHVPGIFIRDASEFHRPNLPVGGTWERLCAISEYVADAYVVQLDADTVTLEAVSDVVSAIQAKESFVLGTNDNQDFSSCQAAAQWARQQVTEHVQNRAEVVLDQLDITGVTRYVRGCSGFSGFAQCSFDTPRLEQISRRMSALLGQVWSEWGTEQFTSNLIVANSPRARVLPHPKYCMPSVRRDDTVFIHFIGYERYLSGLYAKLAGEIASSLQIAER